MELVKYDLVHIAIEFRRINMVPNTEGALWEAPHGLWCSVTLPLF
jgi:hypothetical protein